MQESAVSAILESAQRNGVSLTPEEAEKILMQTQEGLEDLPDREPRVASHVNIRAIYRKAAELGLNRRLTTAEFTNLDRRKFTILTPLFVHRMADGKPADPHVRAAASMALVGGLRTRPYEKILDVPVDLWLDLPTVDSVREMVPEIKAIEERNTAWKRGTQRFRERIARGHNSS